MKKPNKSTSKTNKKSEEKAEKKSFKSYKLKEKSNPNKLDKLFDLYGGYSKEYQCLIKSHWKHFISGRYDLTSTFYKIGSLDLNTEAHVIYYENLIDTGKFTFTHQGSTKHIATKLNASYLQCCLQQVCTTLNGYLSAIENKFNLIINKSSLNNKDSNDLSHQLRTINMKRSWLKQSCVYYPINLTKVVIDDFGNETKHQIKIPQLVSQEALKLAKKIFKNIINKRIQFPSANKPKLVLDNRTCEIQVNDKSKSFDYWLSISTLIPKHKVLIPIQSHQQLNNAIGLLGNTVELNFNSFDYFITQHKHDSLSKSSHKDKSNKHNKHKEIKTKRRLDVIFNKKFTLTEQQSWLDVDKVDVSKKINVVGFDLGLSTLIADSEGNLYGQYWLKKLIIYDKKITELGQARQKLGLNVRSKRYDELIAQVRGFIKTEINRILNKYFMEHHHKLKSIVIEKLYFNQPELSKKLNRIIKNFGQKIFKDKLEQLGAIYNVKIIEVNPAYSSKECSTCHYVDENNRVSQKLFSCKCCKTKKHADYNASKTILGRSEDDSKFYTSNVYKQLVLDKLKLNFLKKVESLFINKTITRRDLINLLHKNKYFNQEDIKLVTTRKVQGVEPARV